MQPPELVAMPLAERLQAMEALWDSLCRDEQSQASGIPPWHEEELAKRVGALDSGEEAAAPWDEVKQRIRHCAEQLVLPG